MAYISVRNGGQFHDVPITNKTPAIGKQLWLGNILTTEVLSVCPVNIGERGYTVREDPGKFDFYEVFYRPLNLNKTSSAFIAVQHSDRKAKTI